MSILSDVDLRLCIVSGLRWARGKGWKMGSALIEPNESQRTEQRPGRVANFSAVLGQVSSAHRTDLRAINIRSSRRSADRNWPEGARYRWRKRRAIAHNLIHCWANRISNVHGSCSRYGRKYSDESRQARSNKQPLAAT